MKGKVKLCTCAHQLQMPVEVVTAEVNEAHAYKAPTKDASLEKLATTLLEDDVLRCSNAANMPRLSVATHIVESYLVNLESEGSNPNEDDNPIKVLSPVLIELAHLLVGGSSWEKNWAQSFGL